MKSADQQLLDKFTKLAEEAQGTEVVGLLALDEKVVRAMLQLADKAVADAKKSPPQLGLLRLLVKYSASRNRLLSSRARATVAAINRTPRK